MNTRSASLVLNYRLLFVAGAVLLAIDPVRWLVGTWIDPAYDSHGFLVTALVAGLAFWSLTSDRRQAGHGSTISYIYLREHRQALVLLGVTAVIRLLGQVLGVNVIGAVALALDVYALALLLGLPHRARPLAPGWLAVLFAFSLPLERIVQRLLGFGLQHLSAAGACQVLSLGPDPVHCEGVRILLAGQDVLVDLPCSGARGLMVLLLLFSALATLTRPALRSAGVGLLVTLVAALASNILRIDLLALGLAYPEPLGSLSVMEAPLHESIGLIALVLGAAPILAWATRVTPRPVYPTPGAAGRAPKAHQALTLPWRGHPYLLGLGFIIAAAVIVSLPAHPVDVARQAEAATLPSFIGGFTAAQGTFSAQEQAYFTRYGGSAVRASYGPYALLVVSTSAPLRHLHAPDECLQGSGHQVRYLGTRHRPFPTAIYRSIDPEGHPWRVAVSFVSARGELATSVSEVVWRWLQAPDHTWTMVQRIAPWETPEAELNRWDAAVSRALDLPHPPAMEAAHLLSTLSIIEESL